MKYYKTFILFSILFISWTSEINGQEIKDILKEQFRKSLITPETLMQRQPYQIEQQRHHGDVLKVSPFPKLIYFSPNLKEFFRLFVNLLNPMIIFQLSLNAVSSLIIQCNIPKIELFLSLSHLAINSLPYTHLEEYRPFF